MSSRQDDYRHGSGKMQNSGKIAIFSFLFSQNDKLREVMKVMEWEGGRWQNS